MQLKTLIILLLVLSLAVPSALAQSCKVGALTGKVTVPAEALAPKLPIGVKAVDGKAEVTFKGDKIIVDEKGTALPGTNIVLRAVTETVGGKTVTRVIAEPREFPADMSASEISRIRQDLSKTLTTTSTGATVDVASVDTVRRQPLTPEQVQQKVLEVDPTIVRAQNIDGGRVRVTDTDGKAYTLNRGETKMLPSGKQLTLERDGKLFISDPGEGATGYVTVTPTNMEGRPSAPAATSLGANRYELGDRTYAFDENTHRWTDESGKPLDATRTTDVHSLDAARIGVSPDLVATASTPAFGTAEQARTVPGEGVALKPGEITIKEYQQSVKELMDSLVKDGAKVLTRDQIIELVALRAKASGVPEADLPRFKAELGIVFDKAQKDNMASAAVAVGANVAAENQGNRNVHLLRDGILMYAADYALWRLRGSQGPEPTTLYLSREFVERTYDPSGTPDANGPVTNLMKRILADAGTANDATQFNQNVRDGFKKAYDTDPKLRAAVDSVYVYLLRSGVLAESPKGLVFTDTCCSGTMPAFLMGLMYVKGADIRARFGSAPDTGVTMTQQPGYFGHSTRGLLLGDIAARSEMNNPEGFYKGVGYGSAKDVTAGTGTGERRGTEPTLKLYDPEVTKFSAAEQQALAFMSLLVGYQDGMSVAGRKGVVGETPEFVRAVVPHETVDGYMRAEDVAVVREAVGARPSATNALADYIFLKMEQAKAQGQTLTAGEVVRSLGLPAEMEKRVFDNFKQYLADNTQARLKLNDIVQVPTTREYVDNLGLPQAGATVSVEAVTRTAAEAAQQAVSDGLYGSTGGAATSTYTGRVLTVVDQNGKVFRLIEGQTQLINGKEVTVTGGTLQIAEPRSLWQRLVGAEKNVLQTVRLADLPTPEGQATAQRQRVSEVLGAAVSQLEGATC